MFAQPVARGFTQPVAFAADPVDPQVFYIAEQGGRIRVVRNGAVLAQDFLDLSGAVLSSGEAGLLGLVLAPDYQFSGRLFVFFINPDGNSVVSRFTRSASEPLRADPESRFDLVWTTGLPYIPQPYGNHKGGHMAFGPDGFLYLGIGDGGGDNDPEHKAQDPLLLLGKMLRIDVNVTKDHPSGFTIPDGNPYAGSTDVLNEIWAFGVRNPWRWSFDNPALGGSGAMLMADVGQVRWEEINYQAAGTPGGANYGWRLREGAHDNVDVPADPGPFSFPLVDPIFEYSHDDGHSITGGYVYRGSALGPQYYGRYFFADFIFSRIWSVAVGEQDGVGYAYDLAEHTDTVGHARDLPVTFGEDRFGELYVLTYVDGRLFRLAPSVQPEVIGAIESPAAGPAPSPFVLSGWAADLSNEVDEGISTMHFWAVPTNGSPAVFLGVSYGVARPDIAALYGEQFLHTGFELNVSALGNGSYTIIAYAQEEAHGQFYAIGVRTVEIAQQPAVLAVEAPTGGSHLGKVTISGYALDLGAASGTGVDSVHIYGTSPGGSLVFLGLANYGDARPDIASTYGAQFVNSGWSIAATGLEPGHWTFTAYLHSSVTNSFRASASATADITSGLFMWIDLPAANQHLQAGKPFRVAGWALDYGATTGTGMGVVHVWAINQGTGAATFVGFAPINGDRPDVGAAFGSAQFRFSGYNLSGSLPAGSYTIIVYAQSLRTGTFDIAQTVNIIVQ